MMSFPRHDIPHEEDPSDRVDPVERHVAVEPHVLLCNVQSDLVGLLRRAINEGEAVPETEYARAMGKLEYYLTDTPTNSPATDARFHLATAAPGEAIRTWYQEHVEDPHSDLGIRELLQNGLACLDAGCGWANVLPKRDTLMVGVDRDPRVVAFRNTYHGLHHVPISSHEGWENDAQVLCRALHIPPIVAEFGLLDTCVYGDISDAGNFLRGRVALVVSCGLIEGDLRHDTFDDDPTNPSALIDQAKTLLCDRGIFVYSHSEDDPLIVMRKSGRRLTPM